MDFRFSAKALGEAEGPQGLENGVPRLGQRRTAQDEEMMAALFAKMTQVRVDQPAALYVLLMCLYQCSAKTAGGIGLAGSASTHQC